MNVNENMKPETRVAFSESLHSISNGTGDGNKTKMARKLKDNFPC